MNKKLLYIFCVLFLSAVNIYAQSSALRRVLDKHKDAAGIDVIRSLSAFSVNNILTNTIKINDDDYYRGTTSLMIASYLGYTDVVDILIKVDASLNASDDEGGTALMFACYAGNLDIVNMLIKAGANINQTDKEGWSALMAAVSASNIPIVKTLLDRNVQVNSEYVRKSSQIGYDTIPTTALMLAIKNDSFEIARLLVNKKADIEAKDAEGNTPLIYAVYSKNEEILKFLLDNKASIGMKNKKGFTALDIATTMKLKNIVTILQEYSSN